MLNHQTASGDSFARVIDICIPFLVDPSMALAPSRKSRDISKGNLAPRRTKNLIYSFYRLPLEHARSDKYKPEDQKHIEGSKYREELIFFFSLLNITIDTFPSAFKFPCYITIALLSKIQWLVFLFNAIYSCHQENDIFKFMLNKICSLRTIKKNKQLSRI